MDKEILKLEEQTQKIIKKYERRIASGYGSALAEMRKEIASLYEKYSDDEGKLYLDEMNKYERIDKLKKAITITLSTLYVANRKEINSALREIYQFNTTGFVPPLERSLGDLPFKIRFDGIINKLDVSKVINEEMAGLNWAERMGKHRSDVIYNVEKTVREGLYNGEPYRKMATRLKDSLQGDVLRPITIVRTEGSRVMQQAQLDIMDKVAEQVGVKKRWVSSRDERTRLSHKALDGKAIPYNDLFTFSDGTQTPAPGISGSPQNVINCRCVLTYDFE